MKKRDKEEFIDFLKTISMFIVLYVHIGTAFYNASPLWSWVTCSEEIKSSYPKLIEKTTLFESQWGFLVTGAVSTFFLISGYTILFSVKKRGIIKWWIHKIRSIMPPYVIAMILNMCICAACSFLMGG